MSKQAMNVNVLAEFIANSFGTSQVLVEKNNRILTIEPMLSDKTDSSNLETIVDKTKAGALTLDDFKLADRFPKGYKFKRADAYDCD
ncbi:MAG: hypothetical protein LBS60_02425 [Deltaproteobacteria bacterium]|jgi:hypothetical protein|nr:hypothetical protein [Deltaproteobacteria bacterium]